MWKYFFDFVAFPVLALALISFCDGPPWIALWLLGVALGTLAEYWVHRSVLHRWLWHGKHERHHKEPHELVVFPVWYTPALFGGFFLVLPLPVFAGFVAWYCWFLYWHHILHHTDLAFARRYADWHLRHHENDDRNFGITHGAAVWDRLFGTYR